MDILHLVVLPPRQGMAEAKGPPSFVQAEDADRRLGTLLELGTGAAVRSDDACADFKLEEVFEHIACFIGSNQLILPLTAFMVLTPIAAVVKVCPSEGEVLKALMMLWPEMFDGLQGLVIHRPSIAKSTVTQRHLM